MLIAFAARLFSVGVPIVIHVSPPVKPSVGREIASHNAWTVVRSTGAFAHLGTDEAPARDLGTISWLPLCSPVVLISSPYFLLAIFGEPACEIAHLFPNDREAFAFSGDQITRFATTRFGVACPAHHSILKPETQSVFRQHSCRPALALAAGEIYRHLVQSQDPATADTPIAISLLDYAGFRYDALAQVPNVDWGALEQMTRFAREQLRAVEPSMLEEYAAQHCAGSR